METSLSSARPQDAGTTAERGHPTPVLFLIDELLEMGGAERALTNMVRLLPQYGFNCQVATFRTVENSPAAGQISCPLHVFPIERTWDRDGLRQAFRLGRLVRAERIQLVHTFFETSDLWGSVVAKLSGCRILVSSRRDMGIQRSGKHRLAYKLLGPLFDQVQTVSDRVREYCIAADHLSPHKVVTVHNGVNLSALDDRSTTSQSSEPAALPADGGPLIISLANIRPIKGIDALVRVAARVCQECPAAKFFVVGKVLDTGYFQDLQALIGALKLSANFHFLGSRSNVFPLLRAADVFCLLSHSEGFSNAIVEAMASNLPCVVSDVGGNREAIEEGKTGFLVQREEQAANRILQLIRERHLAKEMGVTARAAVEDRFTVEAMVEQVANLYRQLLNARYSGMTPAILTER